MGGRRRGRPPLTKAPSTPRSIESDRSEGMKSQQSQAREIREQIRLDSSRMDVIDSERDEADSSVNSDELNEMLLDMEHPIMEPTENIQTTEVQKGNVDKIDPIERKLWVDVIRGNRVPRKDAVLEFEAPKMVDGEPEIEIDLEDIESEIEFWNTGLILFAVGKEMSMNGMKQFMAKVWSNVSLPELYYHDDGYFIARFRSVDDRDCVLQNGPYTVFNVPLFIKKWSPKFVLKDDLLKVMPIWVTFPSLPLHLWGKKSLGKVASAIGNPIVADECTIKKLRVSYARVLIEVDITQQRKNVISIKDTDGRIISQRVKYEWIPVFCQKCQVVGHKCEDKGKEKMANPEKREWRAVARKHQDVAKVQNKEVPPDKRVIPSVVPANSSGHAANKGTEEVMATVAAINSNSQGGYKEVNGKGGAESSQSGGLRKARDKVP